MNLQERLHQIFDQYDRDITRAPKHWERTDESKAALNKAIATIASDLKGILPEIADEPLTDEELEAAGINPQRHKDALTGRNNAIREIQFAIDRYCGVGEMQSKQEPKEK